MIKKLLFLLAVVSFTAANAQNNYLDFDGQNDYVNIPNSENILANANTISMACRVYPKSNTGGFPNFNGIMGYRNETNFDFYIIQLESNKIEARFRNSSGANFDITYTGMTLNQWNHLFMVYDGSTLKLYNGATQVGSVAANGSAPATQFGTLKLGLIEFQAYSWYHNGYIDEASLWNKALSAAEISAIVTNSNSIANPAGEANLKLYYKCNQGVAYGSNVGLTSLTDEKATSNGTLVNFALTGTTSNWGGLVLGTDAFDSAAYYAYPNPTSSMLHFSSKDDISSIRIVDISGRMVQENNSLTTQNPSIDVSQLSAGMYVAVINDKVNVKFVKK